MSRLRELIEELRGGSFFDEAADDRIGKYFEYRLSNSYWWFHPLSRNKRGSYRGLKVVWYFNKRVPSKAVIDNVDIHRSAKPVSEKDIEPEVIERFKDKLG
jgi:hypothetical protein